MPLYTIETTYRLPCYRQRTFEARSLEAACRLALQDEDWDSDNCDYETVGETYITGVGMSPAAYSGPAQGRYVRRTACATQGKDPTAFLMMNSVALIAGWH